MKKILLFALALVAFASCAQQTELRHPKWAYDATIYELNTRQATPEGTFAAAEGLLPMLKENGILCDLKGFYRSKRNEKYYIEI